MPVAPRNPQPYPHPRPVKVSPLPQMLEDSGERSGGLAKGAGFAPARRDAGGITHPTPAAPLPAMSVRRRTLLRRQELVRGQN